MKPQYTCPECGTGFNDQTAYCEDWRNRDRKFGCPSCKTFFSVGVSEIKNKQNPLLTALAVTALLAILMFSFDAALWSYLFVLIIGYQSYGIAGKFFEGNPKMVLTPIKGSRNTV